MWLFGVPLISVSAIEIKMPDAQIEPLPNL
jgi:hypothetical protein